MARFPYRADNVAPLGRMLARARTDVEYRDQLLKDPKAELARIGLPENVVELMTFKIVDSTNEKAVALPYRLNQSKLDSQDQTYLKSIASTFN